MGETRGDRLREHAKWDQATGLRKDPRTLRYWPHDHVKSTPDWIYYETLWGLVICHKPDIIHCRAPLESPHISALIPHYKLGRYVEALDSWHKSITEKHRQGG
jgi:hypothetical protein